MPKPDFSARKTGQNAKPVFSNPFAAWIQGRKERRKEVREQASRMITNQIAQNEDAIVDQLSSIDFLHSRLPKELLEYRSKPDRPCGDLEYASKCIVQMMLNNPQTIKIDIRELDEKMLTLAMLFKQAVEQGDSRAAYAAKGALVRAVNDIRSRIPQNQPELAKQFVELNSKYLEEWITLVGLAQVADQIKKNVDGQKAAYNEKKAKIQRMIDALEVQIRENPSYAKAYSEMVANDTPESRANWTDEQKELHRMMIEHRMGQVNLALNDQLLQQQEIKLLVKEEQVATLNAKMVSVPIVADPDLMNKFNESINQLFDELAASDAEIDETLKIIDEIEGRIAQLDSAPGSVRAREVVTEQAEKILEVFKQRQQKAENGALSQESPEYLKELGLYSAEELKALETKAQEAQLQAEKEISRLLELGEQEDQFLYN